MPGHGPRLGCDDCHDLDGCHGAYGWHDGGGRHDGNSGVTQPSEPVDPFAGDPDDPARALAALDADGPAQPPLSPAAREDVLGDLEDLEVFQALLAPRGIRGLAVGCDDCTATHWFSWDLLRGNLRHLLDHGRDRVHEPALGPDPSQYVSWDYARGFTDACLAADDEPGG